MAIEIKVPSLGDGIETADVLEVFVSEGETITQNQGVVELETDKATAVVPSTAAGKVTKVHVGDGETVEVGAVLLTIETSEAAAPAPAPPEAKPDSKPAPEPEAQPEPVVQQAAPAKPKPVAAPATSPAVPASTPAAPVSSGSMKASEIAAGPAMRRFAREVGVDLSRVQGSGEGGRISRDDILKVVRSGSASRETAGAGGERDGHGPVRREKMSRMRRAIGDQMHRSWSTVPRVTNFDDADVTDLENIRKSSKADYAARGIKLTSMPFVIKAVAMALRDHPIINASLDLEARQVIYKEYVNVGIAVDTDRGLVVPSLRGADDLSIPEIARQLGGMADQVRDNKFTLEDLKGSTFTISNLGAIGGTYSTPIINVPEASILLIGRSRKLPVVYEDQIVPRLMMPLSISYDHRLIDGGAAARFLNDVIGYLEAPSRLLLAP